MSSLNKSPLADYEMPEPTNRDIFSIGWHKLIARRLNALMRITPARGVSDAPLLMSDDNALLPLNSVGSGGGGGAGTITQITSTDASVTITNPTGPVVDLSVPAVAGLQQLAFVSFGFGGSNDYITCTGGVQVRLPPLLRFSVGSRTAYGGVAITYTGYNSGQQSRVATASGTPVTQYITPQYLVGDLVYVASVAGVLQDLNVDGRVFSGP
jgi:hypothetical protein